MTPICSFILSLAAWTVIALSMQRHHADFVATEWPATKLRAWRIAGWLLLIASAVPCWLHWSPSVAIAAWLGLLTLSAITLGLSLTYLPKHMLKIFQ
ncbi:DUF3325 domain-containing protein [Lampropedia puyangensis]|uniref:DUF3325 domain-containing protein n=1 Tax=Lampropedia puyangensis TaxID=1330072 RepID=A0A4S8FBT9_9BURK|nr:DUF3325 domain-containing protein [Lampropedia puyangensis]THU05113.1 DUF3325 domain-containing protein [Lampropedia puyangensis]